MPDYIDHPSPNQDARSSEVALIVLHYTGMETGQAALDRLCDPEAKVSAHYLVEEDGRVFALVPEDRRAWHAGVGGWRSYVHVNDVSVGIEIVNPGHQFGYRPFPEPQIESVMGLVSAISARHGLGPADVIGHADMAPERKDDPGELFPWDRLAEQGLTLPTYQAGVIKTPPDYIRSIEMLQDIGYRVTPTKPVAAVLAFQRRFCPQDLGQGLSPLTRSAIGGVWQSLQR